MHAQVTYLGLGEDLGEQLLVALHRVPRPGPQVGAEETQALAHLHRRAASVGGRLKLQPLRDVHEAYPIHDATAPG